MLRYTLKRLFQTIIVLFGVTLVTFIMVNVVPGDPAAVMLLKKADEADKRAEEKKRQKEQAR